MRTATHATVSLHAEAMPDDPRAARMALTEVFRHKGRLLDATAGTFATLRRRADAETRAKLARVAALRAELGARTLRGAAHADLVGMISEHDALEAELSRRAHTRQPPATITVEAVQRALPARAVLVELVRHRPFQVDRSRLAPAPRYLAYVVRAKGPPSLVDLGLAEEIDEAAQRLRGQLAEPASDPTPPVGALYDRVLQPILRVAGAFDLLLLAPDGPLQLVPFGAFVDATGGSSSSS